MRAIGIVVIFDWNIGSRDISSNTRHISLIIKTHLRFRFSPDDHYSLMASCRGEYYSITPPLRLEFLKHQLIVIINNLSKRTLAVPFNSLFIPIRVGPLQCHF